MRTQRNLRIARIHCALAAVFTLLSLTLLVFIPEVSVLSQPNGAKYFYIDRQSDLPTGDEAVFSDYTLLPLSGVMAGCSVIYLMSGSWLRTRGSRFC